MEIIRQAQSRKPPLARIADTVTGTEVEVHRLMPSGYFVPAVTYIAVFPWMLWLGLGQGRGLPSSYLDVDIGGWPIWSLQFVIAVFVIGKRLPIALM